MVRVSRCAIVAMLGLLSMGVAAGLAPNAIAADSLYTGTIRNLLKVGQSPPGVTPNWVGTLSVTGTGGILIDAGDANFATTLVVSNPPTFAGVLQQTNFLTVMNSLPGAAAPGNGPGPFSFAFPSPAGSPALNPTAGVSARHGALVAAGGGANYGGALPIFFNFVADIVFFGGGGGQPNLACPVAVPSVRGQASTVVISTTCVGVTTGPLPALTLPSVRVPFNVTVEGISATTRTVFAAAPAPRTTTTLTEIGSDVRNTAGTTGSIQLVAPFLFHSQLGGPANILGQNQNAGISEISLVLLPEPGISTLFVGGIAGLWVLRVAERRRLFRVLRVSDPGRGRSDGH